MMSGRQQQRLHFGTLPAVVLLLAIVVSTAAVGAAAAPAARGGASESDDEGSPEPLFRVFLSGADLSEEGIVPDADTEAHQLLANWKDFALTRRKVTASTGASLISEIELLASLKQYFFGTAPVSEGFSLPQVGFATSAGGGDATASDAAAMPKGRRGRSVFTERIAAAARSPSGWQPVQLPNGSAYVCHVPGQREIEAATARAEEEHDSEHEGGASPASSRGAVPPRRPRRKLLPGEPLPPRTSTQLSLAMKDVCVTRNEGWWQYECCWGKHVKQFHVDPGTQVRDPEHLLGVAPTAEGSLFYEVDPVRGPFISAMYRFGTTCDVTNEEREVEVRLYCDSDAEQDGPAEPSLQELNIGGAVVMIRQQASEGQFEIHETEKCRYVAWVAHRKACLSRIKRKVGPVVDIRCRDVATI